MCRQHQEQFISKDTHMAETSGLKKSASAKTASQSKAEAQSTGLKRTAPRARARTAAQLARQSQAFEMSVILRIPAHRIARELKVDRKTVLKDIGEEHKLRGEELGED